MRVGKRWVVWASLIGAGQSAPAVAAQPPAAAAPAHESEYWSAQIQQPDPSAPPVVVLLSIVWDPKGGLDGKGGWTGTLDVPPAPGLPGAVALPFYQVEITDKTLLLGMPNGQGGTNAFQLARGPGPDEASGHFVVNGVEGFPLAAQRITAGQANAFVVPRPQNPRPPFPYRSATVSVVNPADRAELHGTVTMPQGDGPFPGIILVSDMGPHDRDHTDAMHKLFLVLGDRLTRDGFAVLRWDDRGTAGTNADYSAATIDVLTDDARAARGVLGRQAGVDPKRIGLIGYGEGAPIAARVAAHEPSAPFLVLLAPQGQSGADMLAAQFRRQLESQGEDPAVVEDRTKARLALLRLLATSRDEDACRKAVAEAIRADMDSHRGDWAETAPAQVDDVGAQFYMTMTLSRMRSWLTTDPVAAYQSVRCPTLVIGGGLDLIAPPEQNVKLVEAALQTALGAKAGAEASGGSLTVKVFPRVNHQLQPAATGMSDEPIQIRTTVLPEILDLVSSWSKSHAGAGER